ncbi:MAG TPA: thermonuclease family protein [Alphaproteobacteria bacterium]|nr:thermonuclease family protein [Alphaproteobacteria bacterium]
MGDVVRIRHLTWHPEDQRRAAAAANAAVAPRHPLDSPWLPVAAFFVALLGGLVLFRLDWTMRLLPATAAPRPVFAECRYAREADCVVDGDTFRTGGLTIRIADIDTPEIFDPRCPAERALGERAARRLVSLLNAGPFVLRPVARETDVYGRALRLIVRDGRSLGAVLVAEGLARRWDGARRPWC